jgi:hypothetical protein
MVYQPCSRNIAGVDTDICCLTFSIAPPTSLDCELEGGGHDASGQREITECPDERSQAPPFLIKTFGLRQWMLWSCGHG